MQHRSISNTEHSCPTYWYEYNLQGDVVGVYSQSGAKLASYVYDAWGNATVTYHSYGASMPAVVNNPFRYRGYYYDVDLGLYYLQSRYYDANTGRFISPDDVSYLGANGDLNSYNLYAYCSNNPVMYADPSGLLPEWAMWVIGGTLLIGSVALTIATGGAAAGTVAASIHTIATGAMISGVTTATIGTVAGGLTYDNGVASWNWSGAAEGFMWGSITGVISGATGAALSNVGKKLSAFGKIGKLGYAGIQGMTNSAIAAGLTATQGLITNSFSWYNVGLSSAFGFMGGSIGITKFGEGFRSILVGAGLGLGECSIGEIIEWWQSRQKPNLAQSRFAYWYCR